MLKRTLRKATQRRVWDDGWRLPDALWAKTEPLLLLRPPAPVAGIGRGDHKLMRQTLEVILVPRPKPTRDCPQRLCLDKGFDYDEPRALAEKFGFTRLLRTRGEEAWAKRHARAKARRWVVQRTHSWLNRFRSILIRWAKKPATTSPCSTSPSPSLPGDTPYRDRLLARLP